ncbi:MAG TPA: antitoxin VapB family protein [Candidatus Nanoarchaeia archaeon]|nr:antitoxin VapB family protein [Candidatus Nanoarchaeia archaeon]
MATTIQISEDLHTELVKRKLFERESYEEVIWDLIEDNLEINAETKKELAESRADARAGKISSLEQIKANYGLK